MLINTRDIQAFVAVVETGSIVAASSRLNLTQPGITRRVQSLEAALGTPLLDRLSKPLKPTPAGREAYEFGRRVLHSVEDLVAAVMPGGGISGEFRLGVSSWLAEAGLASAVDRLHGGFPKLSLRVIAGWSPGLLAQIDANALDVAVLFLPADRAPPENLARDLLATWPAIIVAGRQVGLPERPTLQQLAAYPWVLNPDGCGFRRAIQRALETRRLPFEVAVEISGPDLQMSLIARGVGMGLICPPILASSPRREAIRIIEVPELHFDMNVWLVHKEPAGRLAGPIASVRDAFAATLSAARNPPVGKTSGAAAIPVPVPAGGAQAQAARRG